MMNSTVLVNTDVWPPREDVLVFDRSEADLEKSHFGRLTQVDNQTAWKFHVRIEHRDNTFCLYFLASIHCWPVSSS